MKYIQYATGMAIAAVVLYSGAYFYSLNSSAYRVAREWAMTAPEVQAQVGNVKKVSLDPLGEFRVQVRGSRRYALFVLNIQGDDGEVRLRVVLDKESGPWTVVRPHPLVTSSGAE